MKSIKTWFIVAGLIAVALVIGFFVGRHRVVDTVYVPVPEVEVKYDTVYVAVPQPPLVVVKAIHDTVLVAFDGNPEEFQILSMGDAELAAGDSIRYGHINVEYIHPPWDEFVFDFQPAPLPTVIKTVKEIQYLPNPCVSPWYESPYVWFAGTTAAMYIAYRTIK